MDENSKKIRELTEARKILEGHDLQPPPRV